MLRCRRERVIGWEGGLWHQTRYREKAEVSAGVIRQISSEEEQEEGEGLTL